MGFHLGKADLQEAEIMFTTDQTIAILRRGEVIKWNVAFNDIRLLMEGIPSNSTHIAIACECSYKFYISLLACVSLNKVVVLLPNSLETTMLKYEDEYNYVLRDGIVDQLITRGARTVAQIPPVDYQINQDAGIVIYTSGSSGVPKKIHKTMKMLLDEIRQTSKIFDYRQASLILSTVPHQHLYGLLFKIIISLVCQIPFVAEIIRYPSQIRQYSDYLLVSSPAFLARLEAAERIDGARLIFSSGGFISESDGKKVINIFGANGYDMYGSTETGGIAYRSLHSDRYLTPIPGVEIRADDEGIMCIRSPYLEEVDWKRCDDRVQIEEDGRFLLLGRCDDVVKIEEKRISLTEIGKTISLYFTEIENVHIVPYETGKRKCLGALILADKSVKEEGFSQLTEQVRQFLRHSIDPVFIPKKWKVVHSLDCNDVGKVARSYVVSQILEYGEA